MSVPAFGTMEFHAHTAFAMRKEGGILPVIVLLQSSSPIQGRIVVAQRALLESGPNRTSIPINVGPGRFRYEIPFPVDTNTRQVQVGLVCEGRETVVRMIDMHTLDEHSNNFRLVGWLGPASPGSTLRDWSTGETAEREQNLVVSAGIREARPEDLVQLEFVALPLENLPTNWHLLHSLDLLAIPEKTLKRLDLEQSKMIVNWVRHGGRIVVDPCIRKEGFDSFAFCQTLAKHCNPAHDMVSVGLGAVAVGKSPLTREIENEWLPPLIRFQIISGPSYRPDPAPQRYRNQNNVGTDELPSDAIIGWTKLERISKGLVFLFLVVFAVFATVGERLLLRRWKRYMLTWGLTPLIAVLFAIGASVLSIVSRGTRGREIQIVVHDIAQGGGGLHRAFYGYISPSSRSHELLLPAAGITRPAYSEHNAIKLTDHNGTVDLSMSAWAHAILRHEWSHELKPIARGRLILADGQLSDQLEIDFPDAEGFLLVYRGKIYERRDDRTWHPRDYSRRPVFYNFKPTSYGRYVEADYNAEDSFVTMLLPNGECWDAPLYVDLNHALFIAISQRGERLSLDPDARQKELHIYRQIVRVQRENTQ